MRAEGLKLIQDASNLILQNLMYQVERKDHYKINMNINMTTQMVVLTIEEVRMHAKNRPKKGAILNFGLYKFGSNRLLTARRIYRLVENYTELNKVPF